LFDLAVLRLSLPAIFGIGETRRLCGSSKGSFDQAGVQGGSFFFGQLETQLPQQRERCKDTSG
jgi:hypothetical protein